MCRGKSTARDAVNLAMGRTKEIHLRLQYRSNYLLSLLLKSHYWDLLYLLPLIEEDLNEDFEDFLSLKHHRFPFSRGGSVVSITRFPFS
jgi:hypothetical protein